MNVNSYHPCVADAEYKQVHSAQDDLSVKKSSVKRQEVRMNENRDVTSFLVSRLNQALEVNLGLVLVCPAIVDYNGI